MKKYRGSITRQAVKDAMDTYDKLAADGTLQKDYDNDNGFLLPEHISILKKAFGGLQQLSLLIRERNLQNPSPSVFWES